MFSERLLDEIEWSLDPVSLKQNAWTIRCPACSHVFRPTPIERSHSLATCPACNVKFTFVAKKGKKGLVQLIVVEIVPARFEEFSQDFDPEKLELVQQIIDYQQSRGYQKGWVYHQLLEIPELDLSLGDWREIARRLGYKAGWGWYKWREMQARYGNRTA